MTVYVFDLDGVITNPENSTVNTVLLEQIHDLLDKDVPVAVNTGRSYDWVEKHLIAFLTEKENRKLFSNLVVVCEKGGELVSWQTGTAELTPSKFALRTADYKKTKDIFNKYADELSTMFWDETKRTMATIEKKPDASLKDFHNQQKLLVKQLNNIFAQDTNIRVDATVIATDVESRDAGKYAGAETILSWTLAQNADHYICFGDSISDYAMAQCFADHNLRTTFVYVGKTPDLLPNDERIQLHQPANHFDAGTLEFLTAQN